MFSKCLVRSLSRRLVKTLSADKERLYEIQRKNRVVIIYSITKKEPTNESSSSCYKLFELLVTKFFSPAENRDKSLNLVFGAESLHSFSALTIKAILLHKRQTKSFEDNKHSDYSKINSNQIFCYARWITPKRVTSWRGPSPRHCPSPALFEEILQRWRTVNNTVSDLTGPRFEFQTSRFRDERVTA